LYRKPPINSERVHGSKISVKAKKGLVPWRKRKKLAPPWSRLRDSFLRVERAAMTAENIEGKSEKVRGKKNHTKIENKGAILVLRGQKTRKQDREIFIIRRILEGLILNKVEEEKWG